MELWIRSQDRTTLIKANRVDARANSIIVWEGYTDIYLGNYKTKERALEVLDEIQNKIKTLLYLKPNALVKPEVLISAKKYFEELNRREFITCDRHFEIIPFSSNVVVYEMPKE